MLSKTAELDRAFHALADPVRRVMVARLAQGPASVSELAEPFSISLPAVLQHLRALEQSGLARSVKKGRVRTVRLKPEALIAAETWIAERRGELEAQLDRFEAYVQALKQAGGNDDRGD